MAPSKEEAAHWVEYEPCVAAACVYAPKFPAITGPAQHTLTTGASVLPRSVLTTTRKVPPRTYNSLRAGDKGRTTLLSALL